ncbi:MAG TPA: polysaccharide deacetylase family protein [Ktedonobacterales bacterium]
MNIRRVWISVLMALTVSFGLVNVQPAQAAQSSGSARTTRALTPSQAEITKVTLADTSIDGPALWTTTNGVVRGVLAWTGTDAAHHLNVSTTSIGTKFSNKVTLPETSPTRPAVTRTPAGKVAVAWIGTDANQTLNVLYDAYGARVKLILWGETSPYSPALVATSNNTLVLSWTGSNSAHSLNLLMIGVGATLTRGVKTTLWSYGSVTGPSLSYEASRSEYLLAWAATAPVRQIAVASSTDGRTWSARTMLNDWSPSTPSLLGIVGGYYAMPRHYMAFTSADPEHALYFQSSGSFPQWPDAANAQVRLTESATGAPALGFISGPGLLLTAWTGVDSARHLNLAILTALKPSPCSLPGIAPVTPKVITAGTSGRREVALTFDAGGAEGQPYALLDTLKNKGNTPASFFFTAEWAQSHQAVVNRVTSDGHRIGNHTVDHADLVSPARSNAFVCYQLGLANQIIADRASIAGTRPYFRPPNGSYNAQVVNAAAGIGYTTVLWSIDTIDWNDTTTANAIYNKVVNNLAPGKIILMHVGSLHEPEALPRVIDYIRSQGYSIVSLDRLLAP